MGDLIYKVKQAWRNIDHLAAHNLEELPQKLTSFKDEVNRRYLFSSLGIGLSHEEFLHLDVVILAEKLKEAEDATERQLVIELSFNFKLICLVTEHLHQDVLLAVEMIIRVNNFI